MPEQQPLTRSVAVRSAVLLTVLVVALWAGLWSRLPGSQLAMLWPAAGVAVWWFLPERSLRLRVLDSSLLLLVAWVANVATGATVMAAAGFALGNLVHALVGRWAVRRTGIDQDGLQGGRGPALLLLASAAAGLAGAAVLAVAVAEPTVPALGTTFLLVWVRNTTSTFLVLLLVFAVFRPRRQRELFGPPRAAEWVAALATGVLLYLAVFTLQPGFVVGFTLVPLSVWSGSRLGLARTAALTTGLGVLAAVLALDGTGGLDGETPAVRVGIVQGFILVTVLTGAVLAAMTEDRQRIADALSEARRTLSESVDAALIGGSIVLADEDDAGLLLQPNPALRRLLRLDEPHGTARTSGSARWFDHLGEPDTDLVRGLLQEMVAGTRTEWTGELEHEVGQGDRVWAQVHLSVLPMSARRAGAARGGTAPREVRHRRDDGRRRTVVAQFLDVTARKDAEAQLTHLALHDDLTGLPNRMLLRDRIEVALGAVRRSRSHVAVVFLDLDHFKTINDSLGHDAGDRVLQTVAQRLRAALRPADTVARIGGDEFVVCCPDIADVQEGEELAARLLEAVTSPVMLQERPVPVGVSAGLVLSRPEDTATSLLRHSDAAMYAAKKAGRGRVRTFAQGLELQASRHLQLSAELAEALAREQFRLLYQPVVDQLTGTVTACEALVRWQHPTRGLLAPAEWLDVAEHSDLILDLGDWVLRRALQDMVVVAEAVRPIKVHVNVSGRQLSQPGMADVVSAALAVSGLPAHLVVLELTETHLLDLHGSLLDDLSQLHGLGVELAVDDFGTGFSSLTQLVRLPLDTVKIDRSFVSHAADDDRARAVIGGVLGMASALGLQVVAEGVETPAEAELLRSMGCASGQGFLWSPPVPLEELVKLLASGFPAALPGQREPDGARPALDA